MYQDTDFGKEVLDGIQMQLDEMKRKLVEVATHKPTDQDFTAEITKLKGAGCDLCGRALSGSLLFAMTRV